MKKIIEISYAKPNDFHIYYLLIDGINKRNAIKMFQNDFPNYRIIAVLKNPSLEKERKGVV